MTTYGTTRRSILAGAAAASAAAVTTHSQGAGAAQAAPSVTYLIKFDVKPGKLDAFLSLLTDVLNTMRNEATFRQAILHRDPQSDHSCSTRRGRTMTTS